MDPVVIVNASRKDQW